MAAAPLRPYYESASPALLAQMPADPSPEPMEEMPGWRSLYQHLESSLAAYETWRLSWWEHWSQIARYELPYRYHAFITANTFDRGLRRDNLIIDETATLCGKVLAAGLKSGLTNPDSPWVHLGPSIPGANIDRDMQIWYDDTADALQYLQTHSNFYESLDDAYEDLVFFGNGVTIDYEDAQNGLYCANYCAGEYFIGNGYDFGDEVLYAKFRMTAGQIVERFGIEKCPEEIRRAWAQKGSALQGEFVVAHAIEPNFAVRGEHDEGVGVVPGGFTWRETFWLWGKANNAPLSMAGFHEKPFSVMRWNQVSNDPYARGPGTDALGAAIQIQVETRAEAEAMEKVNRPPMTGPPELQNQPLATRPDGITYVNTATGNAAFRPAYEIKPDLPAIRANIAGVQERVGRIFYNQLFRAIEMLRTQVHGNVTATEIDALKAEQLQQLGPVIGRVLGTIRVRVRRQLKILSRLGWIKPLPPGFRQAGLKIEFISMLTEARRAASTTAITRLYAFGEQIAPQVGPQVLMNADHDEAFREMGMLLGVPPRILLPPAAVKKLQAAAAQQQQQAQAGQLALAGVGGAKALSETQLSPNNALGALTGAGGGGGAA